MSFQRVLALLLSIIIAAAAGAVFRGDIDLGFLDENGSRTTSAEVVQIPGSQNLKLDRSEDPAGCELARGVVRVEIDASAYPESADHLRDVRSSGEHPLVWHIDRTGADQNREESLEGIPTRDGHDRDELPPATSFEGGEGADVRLIDSSDNRGSGASLGAQLEPYCSGQAFQMVAVAGP